MYRHKALFALTSSFLCRYSHRATVGATSNKRRHNGRCSTEQRRTIAVQSKHKLVVIFADWHNKQSLKLWERGLAKVFSKRPPAGGGIQARYTPAVMTMWRSPDKQPREARLSMIALVIYLGSAIMVLEAEIPPVTMAFAIK